ncbi:MAG: hypothetical protein ACRD0K_12395 [Egibacteraceae bacterium]
MLLRESITGNIMPRPTPAAPQPPHAHAHAHAGRQPAGAQETVASSLLQNLTGPPVRALEPKMQVSSEYEGKLPLKPNNARLTRRFPPNTEETCSAADPQGTHGPRHSAIPGEPLPLILQQTPSDGNLWPNWRLAELMCGFPPNMRESIPWALRPTRGRMKIAAAERCGAAAILLFAPLAYFHPSCVSSPTARA